MAVVVRAARRPDVEARGWTLDDAGHMVSRIDRGVDGIITDRPELAPRVYRRPLAAPPFLPPRTADRKETRMPERIAQLAESWIEPLGPPGLLAAAAVAGLGAHFVLFRILRSTARRSPAVFLGAFVERCAAPSRLLFPVLGAYLAAPGALRGEGLAVAAGHALTVLVFVACAWFLIRLARTFEDAFLSRFDVEVRDNLRARKVHTQVEILRKIVVVAIALLTLVAVLFHFDTLRELGAGILASAGLAGLVLGFAAQRTLANLLAGFQIAITQPIRIDDVLVVEGEWGRVEEITLTYVVLRIWDQRRLILPISHFLEKPFQNWTRVSADLLGSVYLYVDHTLPVDELREALGRIVEGSEHWDGEVWRLHVTDTTEKCVELRAIMSAADSPTAWELRCEVREKLLAHVRERYPASLPRVRAELERDAGRERSAA